MKRKWMPHVIAIAGFVVFGALALGSATAQPEFGMIVGADDFEFGVPADDNGVMIIRYLGAARDVQIPTQVHGMPITEIGSQAFFGGAHLASVTIPDSVIHIWDRAFANNRLTNVTIPNSIVTIGSWAFEMNSLTSITIPDSTIFIWDGAFANNPTLTGITIGNGVGTLYEGVFAGSLRNVTRISIGANVRLQSSEPSCLVWSGFRAAYEANGHRAGIFTLNPDTGQWTWQSR